MILGQRRVCLGALFQLAWQRAHTSAHEGHCLLIAAAAAAPAPLLQAGMVPSWRQPSSTRWRLCA